MWIGHIEDDTCQSVHHSQSRFGVHIAPEESVDVDFYSSEIQESDMYV